MTPAAISLQELRALHILRDVQPEAVFGVLSQCEVLALPAGHTLIEAHKQNDAMYLVLSGSLSVHLEAPDSDPVAFLETGQTVGELSVLDNAPASAHVRTAEPTRLLRVDEDTFWRLVRASHELATNLLLLMSQRMRANNSAIAENTRMRKQFERDAHVDGLTGIYNRRWLGTKLPRLIARHEFDGSPLSVLAVDVDFFKRFNDTHGHAAGDAVLITVARTLVQCLRPTDMPVRYGGEEFVVLLPETDLEGARVAAERLRAAIAQNDIFLEEKRLPHVSISVGVAQLSGSESIENLLKRADDALYRAKHNGRDRVELAQ